MNIPTIQVAEVWLGNDCLASFSAIREPDARWQAHKFCRSTNTRGHKIRVYSNLCEEEL